MPLQPKRLFSRSKVGRSQYQTQLGRRTGKYTTRRHQAGATITNLPDKSKNSIRLIQVPYNADKTVINTRKTNLTQIKNYKFRAWFQFPSKVTTTDARYQRPLQVRWAVLNPKDNDGNAGVSDVDFFISANPISTQSSNFPTSNRSFQYMSRKINREAFGVLKEGSFILQNDNENGNDTANRLSLPTSAYKFINLYVPVKKQMKFISDAATHPEQNLYFVYWYTVLEDPDAATNFTTTANPLMCSYKHTTYFTNSQMFR